MIITAQAQARNRTVRRRDSGFFEKNARAAPATPTSASAPATRASSRPRHGAVGALVHAGDGGDRPPEHERDGERGARALPCAGGDWGRAARRGHRRRQREGQGEVEGQGTRASSQRRTLHDRFPPRGTFSPGARGSTARPQVRLPLVSGAAPRAHDSRSRGPKGPLFTAQEGQSPRVSCDRWAGPDGRFARGGTRGRGAHRRAALKGRRTSGRPPRPNIPRSHPSTPARAGRGRGRGPVHGWTTKHRSRGRYAGPRAPAGPRSAGSRPSSSPPRPLLPARERPGVSLVERGPGRARARHRRVPHRGGRRPRGARLAAGHDVRRPGTAFARTARSRCPSCRTSRPRA